MRRFKTAVRRFAGRSLRRAPEPMKRAIRAGAARVLSVVGPAPDIAAAATAENVPVWQSPPVPVPDGLTLVDFERTYRSWSVNGAPVGSLDPYVDDSLWRFLHTWALVRDDSGTCLEIGANPYFTTYLLERHTKLDLTLANFYGVPGETMETLSFVPPGGDTRIELELRSQMFNVEESGFPFGTDSFDVVLFCETLEHLLMNPVAALREIHRVLRPAGVLILTTPNVARLGNVLALVEGGNVYDPYSGFGPYGRHNREYTHEELHLLLAFSGFEVEHSMTADGHPWDPTTASCYAAVAPTVRSRRSDLGQYLLVRARATGFPRQGLPSFLYRSYPETELVSVEHPG